MKFSDKLKKLREREKLSQKALAEKIGVSERTVQFYETGSRYPKTPEVINRLCSVFNVTYEYLFDEKDGFAVRAAEKYGESGLYDAQQLINEINGLYAGGHLDSDDMDKVFKVVTELYWDAKEKNKKFGGR